MIFKEDFYNTPADKKRCIWDKMALNSRLFFHMQFFYIMYKANNVARHGKFNDDEYCKISDNTFRLLENCGAKLHIKGLEHVRNLKEPVVFIGNHMSVLETFILPGLIIPHKAVSFVVKESLIKHPLFGQIMKATNPISVTRTDPKKDFKSVMTTGQQLIKDGRHIIVFPQSTRGKFIPEEFSSIGEKLAKKANVSIVPIALKTDFWGIGSVLKDFGKIHRDREIFFEFGKPLSSDMEKKALHSEIVNFIETKTKEWGL
jgi:1-acyl-sn-glycerol-3-phosphate acyltransferase